MKEVELAWHSRMVEAELSWQSRIDVAGQSAREAASVMLAEEKAKTKSLSDELCQLRSLVDTYKVGMESERGRTEVLVQERMASYQVAMVGSLHSFSLDYVAGLCLIQAWVFFSLLSPTAGEIGAVRTLQRFGNSAQWSNRPRPTTRSPSRGIREDDLSAFMFQVYLVLPGIAAGRLAVGDGDSRQDIARTGHLALERSQG
jgi:hypothetical protein